MGGEAKMKKALLSAFNNLKFRTKLFVIFGLSCFLPVLVIILVSAQINASNLTDKMNQVMTNNLVQISERVNLNLEICTNLLYQLCQDDEIIENINILSGVGGGGNSSAVAYNKVNNRLKQYNTADGGVRSISVVCRDGSSVIYDFSTGSSIDNLWRGAGDLRETAPYTEAEGEAGMVLTSTMIFNDDGEKKKYFNISKRIFDWDNLDEGSIATVIMTVDERILNDTCNTGIMEGATWINFILDKERTVLTYPNYDYAGLHLNEDRTVEDFVDLSGVMETEDTAINSYEDPLTGWTFYNAYDRGKALEDVKKATILYMEIGLLALLFAMLSMLYLVRELNHSVDSVTRGMREVQKGNLDVVVPVTGKDEIAEISTTFNDMTARIKQLIREVQDVMERKKNAEIRALEAQINPHFLYNTLDSVNWMAIERGEYDISRVLRNLGGILRYSVNKSNSITTLDAVEDWLEKYISLQQLRFEGVFTYQININKSLRKKKIYKLLLQPFIENAIIHGFRDMETGGRLYVEITGSEDNTMLNVIVEDNGRGISQELLEQYNNPRKAIEDAGKSIGLHNAFSRIHMYYGERAFWRLNSIEGMGTVLTLKIPALE